MHEDRVPRRTGTPERSRIRRIRSQRLAHLLRTRRWSPREPYRNALGMSLDNGHAITRSADAERMAGVHIERLGPVIRLGDTAEDLERFPFHFLLFAADVWDNVVEDVHAGYAWVPSA